MPNGGDWVRFCAAIDGFRARYGRWPTRVAMWPGFIDALHYSIGPDGLRAVEQKLKLLEHPDEQGLAAEDDEGTGTITQVRASASKNPMPVQLSGSASRGSRSEQRSPAREMQSSVPLEMTSCRVLGRSITWSIS